MMDKVLYVRLPEDTHKAIQEASLEDRRTMSGWARCVLEDRLAANQGGESPIMPKMATYTVNLKPEIREAVAAVESGSPLSADLLEAAKKFLVRPQDFVEVTCELGESMG